METSKDGVSAIPKTSGAPPEAEAPLVSSPPHPPERAKPPAHYIHMAARQSPLEAARWAAPRLRAALSRFHAAFSRPVRSYPAPVQVLRRARSPNTATSKYGSFQIWQPPNKEASKYGSCPIWQPQNRAMPMVRSYPAPVQELGRARSPNTAASKHGSFQIWQLPNKEASKYGSCPIWQSQPTPTPGTASSLITGTLFRSPQPTRQPQDTAAAHETCSFLIGSYLLSPSP